MKWLLRLIGILLLVVIVAGGAVFFLPGERIAKIAADQISNMTGRRVTMSGDTAVSFYPVLGISTGRVEVANADWSDAGPMMTATSLKVGVDPVALFGGDIKITGLEAVGPKILLERAKDGRVNWEIGVEGVAPSGQSDGDTPATSRALALTLDRALITGATLSYIDHGTGQRTAMENSDMDLRWPAYDGEATFDAVLRPAGQAIEISGRLDNVGSFIAGSVTDLEARIEAPGGTVTFDGRGGSQPQLGGRISADLGSTSKFLAALGIGGVDIPQGLGQALSLSGTLTVTPDMRLSLRDASLGLDKNRLTGAADVALGGAKPRINAQLKAGALDFSTLASGNSEGGSDSTGTAATQGWSKDAIDMSALALFDGEMALVADSLDLGTFNFGKTRVLTTIDRSRAVFELRELSGYGGVVTGQFVANNRNGLSVGGNMKAAGIDMKAFLTDAAGISRFSAKGNASLEFLGVGNSVHAIMNSLNGKAAVKSGGGHISGFDLDKLMRSGNGTGGTTVFNSMGATFDIANGNMQNDDLLMELPLAKATGEGRIGLGAQDIDYLFTPVLLEGENAQGLAIPVRIRGPWSNPRITPDLEKAIDLNLKEEKKKVKAEVKKEVAKVLEKELGVTVEEGQSVEDALQDKLEKEAAKELLKLFQ